MNLRSAAFTLKDVAYTFVALVLGEADAVARVLGCAHADPGVALVLDPDPEGRTLGDELRRRQQRPRRIAALPRCSQ